MSQNKKHLIDRITIEKIIETADIAEVIRDFVTLTKKGKDYKCLCPFHDDKNPSMSVSPSRGIYKCFSCGAAGNTVKFVMEHERMTYPEALKYLAHKYNIEIVEKEETEEERKRKTARESMEAVTLFAKNYFHEKLLESKEGKAIGLSYLIERGFTEATIKTFGIGYAPDGYDVFSSSALHSGYKTEYLLSTGLSIKGKNNKLFDRFAGRVIFPIESISGKVIGFGGRTLKNDKAKYLNSPESELYHKSDVLYGLYFAKRAISKEDKCFLVEGYTDVISMYQAGITNVAASSGTALTEGQIKKIKRFTRNITVLYDGDEAGIKASIRGIDLILEQDMNVKVLPMPEGEDPDSFAKSHSATEFLNYIEQNEQDFVVYKANLLLKSVKNDPIKRSGVIKDVVSTIAIIPDRITRSVYIKECSKLLEIKEEIIYQDVQSKIVAKNKLTKHYPEKPTEYQAKKQTEPKQSYADISFNALEKEMLGYIIRYGDKTVNLNIFGELQEKKIFDYISSELEVDDLEFRNATFRQVYNLAKQMYSEKQLIDVNAFINSEDSKISETVINIISSPFTLSKIHNISPDRNIEEENLPESVPKTVLVYKIKIVASLINDKMNELKNAESEASIEKADELIKEVQLLFKTKELLANILGRVVF